MKKMKYLSLLSIFLLTLGVSTSAFANGNPEERGEDDPPECPVWLCGDPDDDPMKSDK